MRVRYLLPAVVVAVAAQCASQTETQHAFEGSFRLSPRFDLTLHARIRTEPRTLGFYQARGGPILEYAAKNGLSLIGGYFYAQQENSDKDFIGGHRWFGGGAAEFYAGKAARLQFRALAERFDLTQGRDFARYRFRARVRGNRNVAPYGSVENFLDARGWRSTRYAAGLQVGNGSNISFDFGYFLEPRRRELGPLRHMFMTAIYWRFGARQRGDPDR